MAFANNLLSVILKDDDLEKTILEIQNKTGKNILNPSIAFRPSTIRGALMLNNIVKKGSNSICGLDASNEQMGWVMIKGRGGLIFTLSLVPAALFESVYLWGSSLRISRSA